MTSTEISKMATPGTVDEIKEQVSLQSWANALMNGTAYDEPDPGYLTRTLLMGVLTATTPDQVMAEGGIAKLQELVPDAPGQTTGPIRITDLYVTGSDFGEGMPCYVIVTYVHLDTGDVGKFTTGASYIQAQMLSLINLGNWPIDCQVKRINRKDKGGKFLFQMFPAD